MHKYIIAFAALLCSLLSSCSQSQQKFKIAATAVPHAQMLEFIKPDLETQGIHLQILVTTDYNMPNRALAEHEIDANFFQHIPFMEAQIAEMDYPITTLAKIELEPIGIYSKKLSSLTELPHGAQIAIPNDPTNEGRALIFLQKQGLIKLDSPNNLQATILNIVDNPKQLRFIEIDASMLPRSLEDVTVAVINTNYALEAKLSPLKDALALESKDSPYANIIAIRIGEEDRPEIMALKEAMTSEKMRQFILDTYQGAVIPAF